MFTGIIQTNGTLRSRDGGVLGIEVTAFANAALEIGESVAVNGCCLTIVEQQNAAIRFDLSEETLKLTTFSGLEIGANLNIERAMRLGDSLGGHIVQGHVEFVGQVTDIRPAKNGFVFSFSVPASERHLLMPKGSIAVDGISLTIVDPRDELFEVWVIPHTYNVTNLRFLNPGDWVNMELDMMTRTIALQVDAYMKQHIHP